MLGQFNMSTVLLPWKADVTMSLFVRPSLLAMIAFTRVVHSSHKRTEKDPLLFLIFP